MSPKGDAAILDSSISSYSFQFSPKCELLDVVVQKVVLQVASTVLVLIRPVPQNFAGTKTSGKNLRTWGEKHTSQILPYFVRSFF